MNEVLVIGGTGAMGSHVVRSLLADTAARISVLTRDPSSERAAALVGSGGDRVRLVRGDLDDRASLEKAVATADAVFCNTDFFATASPLAEYRQGLTVLEVAEAAGVEKFVWSSLDYAALLTDGDIPVPHYDAKAAVDSYVALRRSEEFMRKQDDGWYTRHVRILVTAPYFENFQFRAAPTATTLPDGREGLEFALPLGEGRYPLIGLEDIGWFAAALFENWGPWDVRTLRVVAESLTGAEIAATFERITGVPAAYRAVDPQALRDAMPDIGHDLAGMFDFFVHRDVAAVDRDPGALRRLHPGLSSFEDWLRRTEWTGQVVEVQKRRVQVQGRA